MEKDYYTEQKIENYKDLRRNLWTSVIVLSGGLGGILFSVKSFCFGFIPLIKTIIFCFGVLLNSFLISSIVDCNKEINKLIELTKGRK